MRKRQDAVAYVFLALSVFIVFIFKNNLTELLPPGVLPDKMVSSAGEISGTGAGTTEVNAVSLTDVSNDTLNDAPGGLVMGTTLDINTATAEELKLLPGIGEKLSERIIRARHEIGGFSDIEELTTVKGISEGKLNKLKDFLRVVPVKSATRGVR